MIKTRYQPYEEANRVKHIETERRLALFRY